jgi:hypothetical protein
MHLRGLLRPGLLPLALALGFTAGRQTADYPAYPMSIGVGVNRLATLTPDWSGPLGADMGGLNI